MPMVKGANLALRFLLELCALVALAYWGFKTGRGPIAKIGLGIGTPLLVAVVWGTFVATSHRTLVWAFGLAVVINAVLMYV